MHTYLKLPIASIYYSATRHLVKTSYYLHVDPNHLIRDYERLHINSLVFCYQILVVISKLYTTFVGHVESNVQKEGPELRPTNV